ncbi:hypothetical protein CP10743SC13_1645, partial [Chlamydia psittaci 10_743_SC13]
MDIERDLAWSWDG